MDEFDRVRHLPFEGGVSIVARPSHGIGIDALEGEGLTAHRLGADDLAIG